MTDTGVRNVTLQVEGMSCGHCVGRVQKALDATPGVIEATVDLESGTASVRFGGETDAATLARAVTDSGYPAKAA